MLKYLLDFISPSYCNECREFLNIRDPLCDLCLSKINPVASKIIYLTEKKILTVHAVGEYKNPLKSFILSKHLYNPLGSTQLAELIWKKNILANLDFDLIVPVPLHWTKKIIRGFNQAEEIALYLSQKTNKPVINLIKKKFRTPAQAALKFKERQNNLQDTFLIDQNFYNLAINKKILLVDDVMTTGSTLLQAAKELLKINSKNNILAVVGARVI